MKMNCFLCQKEIEVFKKIYAEKLCKSCRSKIHWNQPNNKEKKKIQSRINYRKKVGKSLDDPVRKKTTEEHIDNQRI
ncbi:MAG: hypothetical protein AABY22_36965 [Nanoarchaeota archaeon]